MTKFLFIYIIKICITHFYYINIKIIQKREETDVPITIFHIVIINNYELSKYF